MPNMTEIYTRHAAAYDELVRAEDAAGNLPALLDRLVTWAGSHVYEAGAGTGRVTRLFIDPCEAAFATDRSAHMLAFARHRLAGYEAKLTLQQGENLSLPAAPWLADIFIEGWSFGHTLLEGDDDAATTDALVAQAERAVRPDGTVILIETLGTAVAEPAAPDDRLTVFYQRLEAHHRFRRELIRTDYQFDTVAEATRILGFFFGPEMGARVAVAGQQSVREWTGVWWKRNGSAASSSG